MATTFSWIFLGNSSTVLDPTEGNTTAENVTLLNNTTFGSVSDPLLGRVTTATLNDLGGTAGTMDSNNTLANDTITTDIGSGLQTFTFDVAVAYNATITYTNGTTATVTAVVVQDSAGNLYLAPELTANTDTTAYEALPIRSLTLNSVDNSGANLQADRFVTAFRDGVVSGTAGNDVINSTYIEPVANGNDRIDNSDAVLPGATGNDDSIRAGAGNDSVIAGLGNDSVDGGTGADVIDGGIGNDTLTGGSDASADTLFGGTGNDSLSGGDGADMLWGGDGTDNIDGGLGNDTIYGGGGNDTASGGDGADLITETIPTEAAGTVTNSTFDTALTGWTVANPTGGAAPNVSGGQVLFNTGNENTFGDSIQQTLTTTAGSSYTLNLSAGEVGTGNQTQTVRIDILDGTGNVISTLTQVLANNSTNALSLNYTALSASTTIRITNTAASGSTNSDMFVDNVVNTLTPATTGGNDSFSGGAGNDTILAGVGDDVIAGGADNDSLSGEDGNDTISGDDGNDFISGGLGSDSLSGGIGDDTILFGAGDDTVLGGDGNDIIDDVAGSALVGANVLDGGAGVDTIWAGAGNDTLVGGAGADQLFGEDGNDALSGGTENDSLDGGAGADVLAGDAGNDTLVGGAGNDTLTGGAGNDRFVWNAASNNDVISDFNTGNTGPINDGNQANNDFVDLSGIFSPATLAAYNAANGTTFTFAIQALNHDLASNGGVINFNGTNMSGPTLTLTGITGGLTFDQTNVTCFTAGTLIETATGPRPVEGLLPGDLVVTRDHGLQALRWIGKRRITLAEQIASPALCPVRIGAGSLGGGLPRADLLVSPQHRILITGPGAEMLFGEAEVLVVARHLVDGLRVTQPCLADVTYVHLLFDRHEIVQTAGLWSESFQPAAQSFGSIEAGQRAEIVALFSDLPTTSYAAARPTLRAHEARVLLAG